MSWHNLAGPKHIYSATARNSNGRLELFALDEDGDLLYCQQSEPGDSGAWSEWYSLGKGEWNGAAPGSFAVGLSGKGCLELFVIADGTPIRGPGQIFHNRQTNPGGGHSDWTGWHALDARDSSGWSASVGPTVVQNAAGLLDLFVMSANRGVHEDHWWSDYTSSTAVGHFSQTEGDKWDGPELRVYVETCIEAEGHGEYSCTSKLPVKLVSVLNQEGLLELFASVGGLEATRRGVPGLTHIPVSMLHAWQGNTHGKHWWSARFPMPPTTPDHAETEYGNHDAQPVVALNHEGSLELYMGGSTGGDILVKKQDLNVQGGWSSWLSIGNAKEWRHPIVVGSPDNVQTVFASSMTSGTIWYLAQRLNDHNETTWSDDWQPVGDGADTSGADLLHAITNQDGRIELFASGPDNVGFRHTYQDAAGKWS